jgi:hypothetical protein
MRRTGATSRSICTFSHPDWYDADFRPYVAHPLQIAVFGRVADSADVAMTRQISGGSSGDSCRSHGCAR